MGVFHFSRVRPFLAGSEGAAPQQLCPEDSQPGHLPCAIPSVPLACHTAPNDPTAFWEPKAPGPTDGYVSVRMSVTLAPYISRICILCRGTQALGVRWGPQQGAGGCGDPTIGGEPILHMALVGRAASAGSGCRPGGWLALTRPPASGDRARRARLGQGVQLQAHGAGPSVGRPAGHGGLCPEGSCVTASAGTSLLRARDPGLPRPLPVGRRHLGPEAALGSLSWAALLPGQSQCAGGRACPLLPGSRRFVLPAASAGSCLCLCGRAAASPEASEPGGLPGRDESR